MRTRASSMRQDRSHCPGSTADDVQCAKAALLLGGMPPDVVARLLPRVQGARQCHPCSVLLLQRAAWEAREAARENMWEIAAAKLGAILLMLQLGFVDVYRENFAVHGAAVFAANETEHVRFQRCAPPLPPFD